MIKRKALLYNVNGSHGFDYSHCHKPTPLVLEGGVVRVYFGTRDRSSLTRTTFVDFDFSDIENPRLLYVHGKPVLDIGKVGAFDDSGANVSSVLRTGDRVIMYHIGWNPSTTVHTRNAIGMSQSLDGGMTFDRLYDGAVIDRDKLEPYYTGAVDVLVDDGVFKMWYTSGNHWKVINGRPEIFYHIKYAESMNGVDWLKKYIVCIPPSHELEVTARPSVMKENGIYRMWYSRRRMDDFRVDKNKGYRGGYAESNDGMIWRRMDGEFDLDVSSDASAWDSEAIAYPYVFKLNNHRIMLYNGNGFGRTGFGYAIL